MMTNSANLKTDIIIINHKTDTTTAGLQNIVIYNIYKNNTLFLYYFKTSWAKFPEVASATTEN